MNIQKYLGILNALEAMKRNTRHSWLSDGRRESVAEHSWRLAVMAYFVKDEFPDADMDKVIMMCLFHDVGEAFTGDIPAFVKTQGDEYSEKNALSAFVEGLPKPYRQELSALYAEMNELQTLEARIYKALDKMETLIQHNEADISTWIPLEYEENLRYGEKETMFSEFAMRLRTEINRITAEKISAEKNGDLPKRKESKMKRIARFEKVSREQFLESCDCKNAEDIYDGIKLPERATKGSAGYDIFAPYDVKLAPGETAKIPTGIRVFIEDGWVLKIYPRSGLGFKFRLQLNNTVGIIDSDYYNSSNEGHIFIKITNDSNEGKTVEIPAGTGFAQGIFVEYGITYDDCAGGIRDGGFGSTG